MIAIVPAAGKGERFGSQKLLAEWRGRPLLWHTIRALLDGGASMAIVVLAADSAVRDAGIEFFEDPRVRIVTNPDPSRGMFSSIQCGVAGALRRESSEEPVTHLLALPGDMPFVRSSTVSDVIAAARHKARRGTVRVVAPVFDGRRGHPVALPRAVIDAILVAPATGRLDRTIEDTGADWLRVDVSDPGVLKDVDVPADLV